MFKKFFKSVLILTIFSCISYAQKHIEIKDLRSKFARKENRIKFEKELYNSIDTSLTKPLSKNNIKLWREALNDASLYFIKNKTIENSLCYILNNHKLINSKLIYTAVQTSYNLYPEIFPKEVEIIFNETDSPRIFSAASIYLLNYKSTNDILTVLKKRFENYLSNPILMSLDYYLSNNNHSIPPLADLLKHQFQRGKTIVYSVQRKDRKYPGLVIIKSQDGRFLRNEDGTVFHIPQLALSASDFPGFMKNGNTPQGIYSIQKFYYTPTIEIGPSPILLTRIPYEIDAEKFYHGEIHNEKWDITDYKNLLPDSWKEFFPVYESFYAGQSGRRVLVAHGSADDMKFYKDEIYSPLTPTKGCLSTKEVWDDKGRLLESDQLKFMNAFFSTNQLYGFLIVVEIDDKKEPVVIEELLPAIKSAEISAGNRK